MRGITPSFVLEFVRPARTVFCGPAPHGGRPQRPHSRKRQPGHERVLLGRRVLGGGPHRCRRRRLATLPADAAPQDLSALFPADLLRDSTSGESRVSTGGNFDILKAANGDQDAGSQSGACGRTNTWACYISSVFQHNVDKSERRAVACPFAMKAGDVSSAVADVASMPKARLGKRVCVPTCLSDVRARTGPFSIIANCVRRGVGGGRSSWACIIPPLIRNPPRPL